MTLLRDLLNFGAGAADASTLDALYAAESDFIDGLELVARLLALKEQPGITPPTGEPWQTIYTAMAVEIATGADHDAAWRMAISARPAAEQFALTAVVQIGMKAALDADALKNKKRLKTGSYIKEFQSLGYNFRMNICDDSVEVQNCTATEKLNDGLEAVILREMADRGFTSREDVRDVMLASAYKKRFHPARDYLNNLAWDGLPHIAALAECFTDDHNAFALWLRKWLIGAVARVYTGAQNPMLVLDGDQNLGKSTFAQWICPVKGLFTASAIEPDNKDHLIKLINKWVWEVTELGGTMRKADQEALKGFLTLEEVTVRVPFARHAIQKPAMSSFIGTVNNVGGILNDPTGSRRFHIAHLIKIDWSYTSTNVHNVWSEAVAAYLAGERWTLTDDERKRRDEINESYQIEDPIENLLQKFFKTDPLNLNWWIATTEIIKVLEDPVQGNYKGMGTRGTTMALGETMRRLNLKKGKRNNVNGYYGIAPII